MPFHHRGLCAGLLVAACLFASANAGAQEATLSTTDDALPNYEDMQVPSVADLLLKPPLDWVRLKVSDKVIVVEPVYPRPKTLEQIERKIEALNKRRSNLPANELEKWRSDREKLNFVNVVLPNSGDAPEYRVPTDKIEEIIHHEELLLRRVDLLVKAGEQRQAFELLYQLERRLPEWPGIDDRKNHLLFMEAEGFRKRNDHESAFTFFEQLHDRQPDYPELNERLGTTADALIASATKAKDYRRARHFLGRLKQREKTHAVVAKWQQDLQQQAAGLIKQAETATAKGQHDQAARLTGEALDTWPETPGLRAAFTKTWRRFQRLNVGVLQLAGEPTEFFLPTAADLRHEYLTRGSLFEVSRSRGVPHYRTQFFEQWEPTDLGRRAEFRLRPGRFSWEARPETTASDVVNTLNQHLDPSHELYDERLASYVESITVTSPLQLEVKFSRVPLRTEALLAFPLRRGAFEAERYDGPEELADIFSERFRPVESDLKFTRYRRAIPEPDDSPEFHVAEITEHKYDTHAQAVQDLLRGRIDLIARARVWDVDKLIQSQQFFVLKSGQPRMHVLQFNPQSKPLGNREFRRALVHALDRERILKEVILRDPNGKYGRLVTAPYARSSYAYNATIEPREYDPTLSVALRLASRKALGGQIPPLRMVCDPDPPIVAAAERLIADWNRAGISVRLLNNTGQLLTRDSAEWDIVYRTSHVAEPLTELWPFLTMQPRARIADLSYLPDWLRQEIIALDIVGDWKSADRQLKRLHRLLWAEVQLIPLWEVDEFAVFRKHVDGYRPDALQTYQAIDHWTVDAWIPPEAP